MVFYPLFGARRGRNTLWSIYKLMAATFCFVTIFIFLISNPLCSKSDQHIKFCLVIFSCFVKLRRELRTILGDPGADSGDEGKSKRAEKCGAKKSKERREEPLGTMSYQTSSKRSPPFWLLIGARKLQVFWHQSEARTVATVWNWSGKTLSPGALLAVLYFSSRHIFSPV